MRAAGLLALGTVLLVVLAAPPQATGASVSRAARVTDPPNFVVVFLDDMRKDDLVAMPYTRRLIQRQGATFDNAYSPFPLCCPARATILTGQYAHNHGVLGNQPPNGGVAKLNPRHTLGTWLKSAGYRTAYLGKYLNGYGSQTPVRYVPPGWTSWQGVARGALDYRKFTVNTNGRLRTYRGPYQTNVMGARSVDFIRNQAGRKPFFMVSAFVAPHVGRPFESAGSVFPTPASHATYRGTYAGRSMPVSPAYDEADVSDKPAHISSNEPLTAQQKAAHQDLYRQRLESIRSVDVQVKNMLSALYRTGELRNTYIIVTSDNGFLLGEHRVPYGKIHGYEPSARIPLLLRGPGVPRDRHVKQLAGLQDIAPTVLAATRTLGRQTLPLDGRNLIPLTRNPSASARRDMLLEAGPSSGESSDFRYHALRTNTGWKYVVHQNGDAELYDLRNDPHELDNLAYNPDYAVKAVSLAEALQRLQDCAGRECIADVAR